MKLMPIIALVILLFSGESSACSCVPSSDEEEFRSAKSVLLVRLTRTEFVPATSTPGPDVVRGEFEIVRAFKGERGQLQFLVSSKGSCHRPLLAGELYIVFARGAEFEHLSMCTQSRGVRHEEDAEFLADLAAKLKFDSKNSPESQ